jgi:glycosyltransferase involved in cell wall biosynthesis
MIRGGLPANRVHHITNFADPVTPGDPKSLHALREALSVQADDLMMLTAGRLIDVKGHQYLLDALSRLPADLWGRRLRLIVLGDGPLMAPLVEQSRRLGIADRVHWAGWQHDPAPWFELADLVVFPSRDPETLGNVILEAWSHGKPLVATAFRGARELTRHQQDAWIVPCDDGIALAEGLRAVISDTALQAAMVREGLARIEREFSIAAVIGAYRGLYNQLNGER